MAGSITSLGTGSNLGLQDILDKLQASENQRLTIISARQDSYKAKLSAYSQIQNSLSSLQKAAAALSDPKTFNAVKGTTSGDAVSIRTSAGALPAEYAIEVEQLATAMGAATGGQSSRCGRVDGVHGHEYAPAGKGCRADLPASLARRFSGLITARSF